MIPAAEAAAGIGFARPLAVTEPGPIPGLLVVDLPVHGDNRGWFKENWQREKMLAAGLPDFGPVQNNVSFNASAGTTRGIHAEPWDKFVSVATGRIFGAWVDLREGPTFGTVFTAELDPSRAVFVPRGVGNAFQTLEDGTAYSYLVNDHWSADAQAQYTFLNLADETAAIDWPIPLERAELSDKDRAHPRLDAVVPMPPCKTLVLGANGQLGRALRAAYDGGGNGSGNSSVVFATRAELDLADPAAVAAFDWSGYGTVINAAAHTAVDAAETGQGRRDAWAANVTGVAALARACLEHRLVLVHVSSDYVFDGGPDAGAGDGAGFGAGRAETEPVAPLGVYGQTKAAADAIVSVLPKHYILRTSWVVGEGANFVATMASLAGRGISPSVVDDQVGRLTFTRDLAEGIRHLLDTGAPYGTYNLTNAGEPMSWARIAAEVYAATGHDPAAVTGVSTAEYFAGKQAAPRPANSVLDLSKIRSTGFEPEDQLVRLREYLQR
ncbi:sugar nucleotide-binding protein [Zafaria cholistanensis]|uniref:sugar nucleotide-binding protein n=1 Tax=Zafaria cholistanensis TaxID=1682741 RepID=UPI0039C9D245